jgi:hypothetical protein
LPGGTEESHISSVRITDLKLGPPNYESEMLNTHSAKHPDVEAKTSMIAAVN